jgi:hypothetical protein
MQSAGQEPTGCTWEQFVHYYPVARFPFSSIRGSSLRLVLRTAVGLVLGCGMPAAHAQITLGDKTIVVPRLTGTLQIDGRLDEPQWAEALVVEDLHQYAPYEYTEPSQKSRVWIFYTEEALYVASFFEESDPSLIAANIMRQGEGLTADDIFSVILDPYLDRRSGYRFTLNPNGVRWEGLYQNITDIQGNWDGIWQGDARVVENGWYTEMRIPYQSISFNPDSDAWGINFRREIRRNSEGIGWVSRNRQMNPSIAGTMTGLSGLQQGLGLDVVPSMTVREDRVYGPASGSEYNFEPSLDVFYKITPQLNASLTINTDFSAAEVDTRQVNLTRFSLFFPERRDFFIREADIFEFGQIGAGRTAESGGGNPAVPNAAAQNARPFFSRRIGLSANGAPVDINYGGKLSGRVGDWNVGALLVSQDADARSGIGQQDIFVGRAVLNVLGESQIGVITTAGAPQSDADNSLVGMDFRYRNSNLPGGRAIQAFAFVQQSDSAGRSGEDASWGMGVIYPSNQGLRGAYSYKEVEANFNPAVGFVNQTAVSDHALDIGYRKFLAPGGYVRSVYAGIDAYRAEYLDDRSVNNQNAGLRLAVNNNSGDNLYVRTISNREVLREDFVIYRAPDSARQISIPAGAYSFNQGMVGLELADQRKVGGGATLLWGDYYGGERVQSNVDVIWRPAAQFGFGLQYTLNEIRLLQGNFSTRLYGLQSRIAFSNKLSWSTLVQYDNVSEAMGINSRLHWIPEWWGQGGAAVQGTSAAAGNKRRSPAARCPYGQRQRTRFIRLLPASKRSL